MEYRNAPGRIYDIQGYAVHDGPGIRTTVFTKGCPLRCLWCHSPESQKYTYELGYLAVKCLGTDVCKDACINACPNGAISKDEPKKALDGSGTMITKAKIDRGKCVGCLKCSDSCIPKALYATGWDTSVDEVFERVYKDRDFFTKRGGITISGGEAMAQFEFTLNLAKRLHEVGIDVCLDTTGYAKTELFAQIIPYVNLFLYDIKHMDSTMHEKLTGVGNELILENARYIAAHEGALQVRVPIIPKLSDGEPNLRATAQFCSELGEACKLVQLLPYHKTGRMKYERLGWKYRLTNVEPPSDAFMQYALELFLSYGLTCQLY
ncbi:MAG: glycyl-radical enzyme activating protein [Oscillospiraceae bacterium]|jgi:pyruvate formate lyase activating enzyme|nr:glycyl-radical enzyme activating protein [Oscillospiraceae bacterium]